MLSYRSPYRPRMNGEDGSKSSGISKSCLRRKSFYMRTTRPVLKQADRRNDASVPHFVIVCNKLRISLLTCKFIYPLECAHFISLKRLLARSDIWRYNLLACYRYTHFRIRLPAYRSSTVGHNGKRPAAWTDSDVWQHHCAQRVLTTYDAIFIHKGAWLYMQLIACKAYCQN